MIPPNQQTSRCVVTHCEPDQSVPAVSDLIERIASGDDSSRSLLFAHLYRELRSLAQARLRRYKPSLSMGATSLTHETYVRFIRTGRLRFEDQRKFLAFASKVMRTILIDELRSQLAERRGGGAAHVDLDEQAVANAKPDRFEALHVHEALHKLAELEPRVANVVELRYFGGLTEAEIAEALDVAERTVRRDWERARAFLFAVLHE